MTEQRKRVRVYSLSTCLACKKVKQFLEDHNIKHEYIEVDKLESGEQWLTTKELKKYNPTLSYPSIIIEEVIIGFDENAIRKALEIDYSQQ